MELHFTVKGVDTVDKYYLRGVEDINEERLSEKPDEILKPGVRLVEEVTHQRNLFPKNLYLYLRGIGINNILNLASNIKKFGNIT